jgi:hypothetical protein
MNFLVSTKGRIWLILLLALMVLGSVSVLSHNSRKAATTDSAIPPPLPSKIPKVSAATIQPRISWSQQQIVITLSPGESTSRNVTFTSDLALQNIVIESVPEIASFLTIQPSSFASMPANQPQPVQIAFSIPAGTAPRTYDGTIHVPNGTRTLPQTLKVIITVERGNGFSLYENDQLGFQILYPTGSEIVQDENTVRFFDLNYPELPATFELDIFTPLVDQQKPQEEILVDIARQRLGEDFINVVRFTRNGVIVEAGTIDGLHFFSYDSSQHKSAELRGRSPDFFLTDALITISESLRFF